MLEDRVYLSNGQITIDYGIVELYNWRQHILEVMQLSVIHINGI